MPRKSIYTTEILRQKGKEIYGDKYDFSQSIFISDKKSTFGGICKEHGSFKRPLSKFLAGKGCPKCAMVNADRSGPRVRKETKTTEQFIAEARAKHGDLYDYSKTVYHRYETPVTSNLVESFVLYSRCS